jgi:hypothetical protein
LFSISSINSNLTYITFFNLILILLISIFFHLSFCKSFIGFHSHSSIQIYGVMFSNLVLIVLIFIFFLTFFKIFIYLQFLHSIQIYGVMFSNLILIVLIFIFFLDPFLKVLFVCSFIIKSKFIVYYFY